jgi:predicted RND superfamily exporter protein
VSFRGDLILHRIIDWSYRRERPVLLVAALFGLGATLAIGQLRLRGEDVFQMVAGSAAGHRYDRAAAELGSREALVAAWDEPDPFNAGVLASQRNAVAALEQLPGVRQALSFATSVRAERVQPVGIKVESWGEALISADSARRRALIAEARNTEDLRDFLGQSADLTAVVMLLDDPRQQSPPNQLHLVREVERLIRLAGLADGRAIHIVGLPAAEFHAAGETVRSVQQLLPAAAAATGLVTFIMVRRLRVALLVVAIGLLAALSVLAMCALFRFDVSVSLAALPVLTLAVTSASLGRVVHDATLRCGSGESRDGAVQRAFSATGAVPGALVVTMTMFVLFFAPAKSASTFGLLGASGLLIGLLLQVTLGATLLRRVLSPAPGGVMPGRFAAKVTARILTRSPRATLVTMLALGLASVAAALAWLEFETDWVRRYRPGHPFREAHEFMNTRIGGTTGIDLVIRAAPREARRPPVLSRVARLENELVREMPIDRSLSVTTVLRRIHALRLPEERQAFGESEDRVRQALFFLPMAGEDALIGLISPDASALRVTLRARTTGLIETWRLGERIRAIADSRLDGFARVEITGVLPMLGEWLADIQTRLTRELPLAFLAVLAMLAAVYRNFRTAAVLGMLSLVPIFCVLAVHGVMRDPVDAEYLLIIAVAYAVTLGSLTQVLARHRTARPSDAGGTSPLDGDRRVSIEAVVSATHGAALLIAALVPLRFAGHLSLAMWSDRFLVLLVAGLLLQAVAMPVLLAFSAPEETQDTRIPQGDR